MGTTPCVAFVNSGAMPSQRTGLRFGHTAASQTGGQEGDVADSIVLAVVGDGLSGPVSVEEAEARAEDSPPAAERVDSRDLWRARCSGRS